MEDEPEIKTVLIDLETMPITAFQRDTFRTRIENIINLNDRKELANLVDQYELIYDEFYKGEYDNDIEKRFIQIKDSLLKVLSEI